MVISRYFQILISFFLLLTACKPKPVLVGRLPKSDSIAIVKLSKAFSKTQIASPDSALLICKEMRVIWARNSYTSGLMDYYRYVTTIYSNLKQDTQHGKLYADSAWLLAKEHEELLYKAHHTYGIYNMAINDYTNAATHFLSALKLQPQPIDSTFVVGIDDYLADISSFQGNYKGAIHYYEPVLRLAQKSGDTSRIVLAYMSMYEYCMEADSAKAAYYLFNAKALSKQVSDKSVNAFLNYYLGRHYYNRHRLDSAAYYLKRSVQDIQSNPKDFNRLERPYLLLIELYNETKQFAQAKIAINKLQHLVRIENMVDDNKEVYYSCIYTLDKHEHNIEGALSALERIIEVRKTIERDLKDNQLLNYEKELTRLSSENTIVRKNDQIRKHVKYSIIATVVAIIFLINSAVVYWYWSRKKKLEDARWREKEKTAKLKSEKALLQLQINERNRIAQELHDDIGTTTTSVVMAVELLNLDRNNKDALEIINSSARLLNKQINEIVWSMNTRNDNLQNLIAYIFDFARSFLHEANIGLSWTNDDCTDVVVLGYKRRIIYLAVKELLNNVVKHAKASNVIVTFECSNDFLNIEIADDGIGFVNDSLTDKGNGILNIQQNIKKLNGVIDWSDNNGTRVNLSIPI
jgi:signal transduction histidine kinase